MSLNEKDACIHQYRNRFGEEVYRDAIVHLLKDYYHYNIPKESILATSGVSGAIFSSLLFKKTEKNDLQVALMVPFYTYHLRQIQELLGKDAIFVNSKEDCSPHWSELENVLAKGLDVLIITNPGNPRGNVWKKEDLKRLVKMTEQANCLLIIDEIYCDLVWKGPFYSPISEEKLPENVIVCRGFAKSLGAQSWRCGFAVSTPSLINKLMRVHDPVYISVPWTQHAIADYLREDFVDFGVHVAQLGDLMQNNWRILSKAFHKKLGWDPIEPEGSMYGMFKHHQKSDTEAVLQGLRNGVGVAPGKIFYPSMPENTGFVRIHCGISSEKAKEIASILEK